jgi:hypothetical protein
MIYNTGKVKIGLHYTPPVRPADIGRDMMLLQTALLAKPKTAGLGRLLRKQDSARTTKHTDAMSARTCTDSQR